MSVSAVVLFEQRAFHRGCRKIGPSVTGGNRIFGAGQFGALVGHLEEQESDELFEIVLVREAVVAQDVAEVPEL